MLSLETIIVFTILFASIFKGRILFLRYGNRAVDESTNQTSSSSSTSPSIWYGDFKGSRNMYVGGSHLFCNPRSFVLVEENKAIEEHALLLELNLPNGTLLTEELREFARCLVSARHHSGSNKLDYCWCFGGMAYGSLFIWAALTAFVGCCCCISTLTSCADNDGQWPPSNVQESSCLLLWALLKFLFWLFCSSYASYAHLTWMDDVILPPPLPSTDAQTSSTRSVNYFRRPWIWDSLICLAWLYCICCLVDILIIAFVAGEEDKKHECDKSSLSRSRRRRSSSYSPPSSSSSSPRVFRNGSFRRPVNYFDDQKDNYWDGEDDDGQWSVVSYPSSIKNREKSTRMPARRPPSILSFP